MTDLADPDDVDGGADFDADPADTDELAAARDDVVARVRDHAGRIARELALLQGGDYGSADFDTDDGEWTLKYEGGDLQYLRFDPKRGSETYVVSTKQPPEPDALAAAMEDYDAFVAAYNEHVASLDGVLDGVDTDFPEAASTDEVVAQRDRVLDAVRDVCDQIADRLYRFEGGDYGTYTARVSGTRWELKWEDGRSSYLRVGGSGGVYLLSQYEAPAAADVRELAGDVPAFVDSFNEYVEELESDLDGVAFGDD
ncbi:hypothetical protein ACFO0N_06745 [Halobium salinum]|uniref:Profilin fold domain-containing protein n=1 Tax=Halobium salinum TaxID=1364940 RepID=A0ABD5PA39_9EURY|nr:hypothetical protein [Halobium salinum]